MNGPSQPVYYDPYEPYEPYDPYEHAIDEDPHPTWRRMRDEAPVYRNGKLDFYALSRFQDILDASLDAKVPIRLPGS